MSKKNERNEYYFFKKELSKLLKETNFISFYNDEKIIENIINLLVKNESINKINGIILTSEIQTYGGSISEKEVAQVFEEIIGWWNDKK